MATTEIVLSVLEQVQGIAISCLESDDMFSGIKTRNGQPIPLLTEVKGDITQQIELAISSVGVCVLVMTPAFEFIDEMLDPPDLAGMALVALTVFEDVPVNLGPTVSGIPAIRLAQQVLGLLHGHLLNLTMTATPLRTPAFIGTKRPIVMTNEGPPLQYTISFQAYVSLLANQDLISK